MGTLPETEPRPHYKYERFLRRLIEVAEKVDPDDAWLAWPDQKRLSKRTRNVYANRLRRGEWGPGFEGVVRNGYLYARYVGQHDKVA